MDINQTARMIEWLDEERRRDKALIATLEQRLQQQQELIDTMSRRMNSVESDQTVMRTQMLPSGRDSEMMDQLRKEMQQVIETIEAKRLTAEREAERRAELNRESLMRTIREVTDKTTRLERTTTEIPAINVERDRLQNVVASLQQRVDDLYKRLEEPDRRIAHIEEQRRIDGRRLGDLESELPEVRKALDSVRPKITLLEELAMRTERKVTEVQNAERDRRDQIQQFIDQQTLLIQQRDQQVEKLTQRFSEQETEMQRYIERFETWAEAYRAMKKIIEDFERIGDRLERRINEVAEIQRLSEERFRQEWNDWRSEDQKRWKQFTLSNDEVWRQHDKEFDRFVNRIAEMQEFFPPLQDAVNRLWKLERERAQLYRDRYQALLHEHDTGTSLPPVTLPTANGIPGSGGKTDTNT
jgi:chromosome segregation ATPase